ncbi:GDSL-type esterase/lipase family protein [Spirosoma utsteinense]|uniref:GDSL-type esterase/lipase family protein n=1 Tax=Spirosoma utsteinense TaxID=2585773 RepID=UPI001645DE6B|nr:GDSL-type esterase/lipase family protein [Spirosoma utsteinense]MBC3787183.1 lysophospholipase L1-like esterase [Spirosoma utsteinense]
MKKSTVLAQIGYRIFLFFFICQTAVAQPRAASAAETPNAPFELKNGDRVVFVGNSLFENDFQYGYLELALTTRWPDRNVTYRNLGWTGDNVYGVARSTITNPPTGYELLMEHLTKAAPTLVFIGYGGIEAQEGEAGLTNFIDGLAKLLDKVDQLGAKAILLSPIPILSAESAEQMARQNAMLETYASAVARLAAERGKRYIDLFKPMQAISPRAPITDNGIHLNETGYYRLATILEQSLGLGPRHKPATISMAKNTAAATGPAHIRDDADKRVTVAFTLEEPYLPLPPPVDDKGLTDTGPMLKITGLKKGFYTLTADRMTLVTASAKEWEEGVLLNQGGSLIQARELQQMILKKNDLFYFQYRPLNTTYILGFRSYEQGRHVKGLEEQSILIKWLEGQIAVHRTPASRVYQLSLLK